MRKISSGRELDKRNSEAKLRPITVPEQIPGAETAQIVETMRKVWESMPQVADSGRFLEEDRNR